MSDIQLGTYRHYKGGMYRVIGIAHHSETKEKLVVYQSLSDSVEYGRDALWVRPLDMFLEKVSVGDNQVARFEYIKESL